MRGFGQTCVENTFLEVQIWSFRCNEAHLKQQTMRGLRIGGLTWKFEMPLSTSL